MCGATRLLFPAFLVGVSVSTLSSNDLLGWAAAALTVAVLVAVQKLRGTSPSCAIRGADAPAERASEPAAGPAPQS
jgi:hypothetical protein